MDEQQRTEGRGEVSEATRAPRSAAQADARASQEASTPASSVPLAHRLECWHRVWRRLFTLVATATSQKTDSPQRAGPITTDCTTDDEEKEHR